MLREKLRNFVFDEEGFEKRETEHCAAIICGDRETRKIGEIAVAPSPVCHGRNVGERGRLWQGLGSREMRMGIFRDLSGWGKWRSLVGMRMLIGGCGFLILLLGVLSHWFVEKMEFLGFLNGALTVGGSLLICAGFMRAWHWHGMLGAGVVALLCAARGLGNVPHLLPMGGKGPSNLAYFEFLVTLLTSLVVIFLVRALLAEKRRRSIEELLANQEHEK